MIDDLCKLVTPLTLTRSLKGRGDQKLFAAIDPFPRTAQLPECQHMLTRRLARTFLAAAMLLPLGCSSTTTADRVIAAPPDTALIAHPNGRTTILHDGKPVPLPAYCDYIMWQGPKAWTERIEEFAKSGATVFMINVPHGKDYFDSHYWTDENVYPNTEPELPLSMDAQMKIILALVPNAKVYVRTWVSPPMTWVKKFPGEIQTDEDGKSYRQATISSPLYIEGITKGLKSLVNYCESRPWGDRIVGYLPAPLGEGITPLNCAGKMFDCSPAAERDFRVWLKKKYASDADLQKAWGDSAVTRDTAKVPRDVQWFAKRATAIPSFGGKPLSTAGQPSNGPVTHSGLFHFIEPAVAAAEHDYCYFQRDSFIHWFSSMAAAIKEEAAAKGRSRIVGFDICKQPLMGWQIISAFDGAGDNSKFPNILQLSGSFDVGPLLDDKNIDVLFTPADYHARTVGFAFEPEGPADSMVLRGKTLLTENDARSYVGAGVKDQGAFRDPVEVEAGLFRNEALAISRNFNSYWCNVGSSYFHDPKIQQTVAKLIPALNKIATTPHRETADAIAFIVDDNGPMYEDFSAGFQSLAVIWQRIQGLAHCGVPYRIYTLSDMKKDNFPNYKVYFFPNLFRVDDEVLALLHKKVLRDGNLAIFGPATGITDGKILTAEPASKLLGVTMELLPRTTERRVIVQEPRGQTSALVRDLPAGLTFGDTLQYGPTLVPGDRAVEKAGGQSLGMANTCFFINRTGFFLRENGNGAAGNGKPGARGKDDYAMLWSVAAPLPPNVLRETARYAGCNIWSEENDVVYASDTFVGLHTVKAGEKKLRFPRAVNVIDAVTGERLGSGVREVKFKMEAVQTRLLRLE